MQKQHTKKQKMTSRRAVAPVIATLLLVAIAVVGGSIIFVFSQGFFSQAQVSGAPQIESLELVGYDAGDVNELILHDGLCSGGTDPAAFPCGAAALHDQDGINGLEAGERVAVYVQNQSAQDVTLQEVSIAGVVYTYFPMGAFPANNLAVYTAAPVNDAATETFYYQIVDNGLIGATAEGKDGATPILSAGDEVTIVLKIKSAIQQGRDAQFKMETANGAIFVGTIIAGQNSG